MDDGSEMHLPIEFLPKLKHGTKENRLQGFRTLKGMPEIHVTD
jgi:hypothetical protein